MYDIQNLWNNLIKNFKTVVYILQFYLICTINSFKYED